MRAMLLGITTCHVADYTCAINVMLGEACKLSSLDNVSEAVAMVDLETLHYRQLSRL